MFVGPYQLLRPLGTGGMAEVWQAQWIGPGGVAKTVALKWPRASDTRSWGRHAESFAREQQVSMLMTHSNIAQVFDVGVHEGRPYMAMEWVDGVNLAKLVERLRAREEVLGLGEVAYVIGEILRGLAYAHALEHEGAPLGIVHRDVSPQNVLVSVSGEIKLVDFGVARAATHETSGEHVKGKLRYMAPEQLVGGEHGAAVDLYAVGVILHELVAGVRMRDAKGEEALMAMVRAGVVPALEGLPSELAALRGALLSPDPAQRPASARDALRLLSRWQGYRPLSSALARRVTGVLAVTAPRSGVHAAAEKDDAASGGAPRRQRTPPPAESEGSTGGSSGAATALHGAATLTAARPAQHSRPSQPDVAGSSPWDAVHERSAALSSAVSFGSSSGFSFGNSSAMTARDMPAWAERGHGGDIRGVVAPRASGIAPRTTRWRSLALGGGILAVGLLAIASAIPFVAAEGAADGVAGEGSAAARGAQPSDPEGLAQRAGLTMPSAAGSDVATAPGGPASQRPAGPPGAASSERLGHTGRGLAELEAKPHVAAEAVPGEPSVVPDAVYPAMASRDAPAATGAVGEATGVTPSFAVGAAVGDPSGEGWAPGATVVGAAASDARVPSGMKRARGEPQPRATPSPRGEVVVKAGDFEWAVLRIDRRDVLVEPRATVQLAAGRHKLAVRGPGADEYVVLDPIEVEAGARYELRLRAPAGYGLSRLRDGSSVDGSSRNGSSDADRTD
jgi:hypothetical protein